MKTLLFISSVMVLSACEDLTNQSQAIKERQYIEKTQTLNPPNFKGISINRASTAQIQVGEFSVQVTGDSTDLKDLQIKTFNENLSYDFGDKQIKRFGLNFKITLPEIKSINVLGASKASLKNFKNQQITANVFGASELDTYDMNTQKVIIDISGASKAKIQVSENLEAKISGASQLLYRGNPVLKTDITGSSTIQKD